MLNHPKVSVIMPVIITQKWQEYVTETSIRVHRENTKIPFELIIVETISDSCNKIGEDKYLRHLTREGYGRDFNSGIDIADGDFIVHTGNDIFPQPGWLEALFQCFEIKDCGIALIGSKELKHVQQDKIIESISCPQLMMFKKGLKFDENYKNVMVDVDLIMQVYEKGLRSYRNLNVLYHHLCEMTVSTLYDKSQYQTNTQTSVDYFKNKFQNSHLLMFQLLATGQNF